MSAPPEIEGIKKHIHSIKKTPYFFTNFLEILLLLLPFILRIFRYSGFYSISRTFKLHSHVFSFNSTRVNFTLSSFSQCTHYLYKNND